MLFNVPSFGFDVRPRVALLSHHHRVALCHSVLSSLAGFYSDWLPYRKPEFALRLPGLCFGLPSTTGQAGHQSKHSSDR